METCVLIPSEFSLVLCPNKDSKENHNSLERRKGDDNVNRLYEMNVCVWSNQYIPKGTLFLPFQGTIRLDRLEVHSLLMKNDIRYRFGCFDEIQQIDNQKVRHCNWIRFLRHLPSINSKVNLIGRLIHGEIIYETISNVRPNTEMIAFYDTKSIHESRYLSLYPSYFASTPVISSHHHAFICRQALQDSPLDLSMSLVKSPASSSSSLSFSSLSSSTNQEKMSLTSDPSSLTLDLSKSSSLSSASSIASPSASLSPSSVKSVSSKGKTMIDNHEMSFKSDEKSTIGKNSPLLKLNGTASLQLNHKPSATLASHNQSTNINKKARERTMLPCEYCGKAFDRPSLLRRHLRTHTGEKPHVCDVCGKGFSTSSSLNTHRRIHTGEKPHQCNVCCKRFTASSNLYYHRMTHNKEKPHKCTLCSKSFPTPGDLKSHMYVHNGSWPFKCHICNRGFSKQTNLRNHMYLHTGDRPHECEKCPKKFALACNLRAHLKTHEDSNTSRCSKCGREYRSSSRLLTLDCCADCYQQNHEIPLLKTH